ncbi:hypothetical protein HKX48_006292 [Thoreauomyces humboldtii]|nr:hypothetical protein HKX48_006292 [Thoreauomyces humboldtii]
MLSAVAPEASASVIYTQYDRVCFAYRVEQSAGTSLLAGAFSTSGPISITYSQAFGSESPLWFAYHGRVELETAGFLEFAAAFSVPETGSGSSSQQVQVTLATDKIDADGNVVGPLTAIELLAGLGYSDVTDYIIPPGFPVTDILQEIEIESVTALITETIGSTGSATSFDYFLLRLSTVPSGTGGWEIVPGLSLNNIQLDIAYLSTHGMGWGANVQGVFTIGGSVLAATVQYASPLNAENPGSLSATIFLANLNPDAIFSALCGSTVLAGLPITALLPELQDSEIYVDFSVSSTTTDAPAAKRRELAATTTNGMTLQRVRIQTIVDAPIQFSSTLSLTTMAVDLGMVVNDAGTFDYAFSAAASLRATKSKVALSVLCRFTKTVATESASLVIDVGSSNLLTIGNLIDEIVDDSTFTESLPSGFPVLGALFDIALKSVSFQFNITATGAESLERVGVVAALPLGQYTLIPDFLYITTGILTLGVNFPTASNGLDFAISLNATIGIPSDTTPIKLTGSFVRPNPGQAAASVLTVTALDITIESILETIGLDLTSADSIFNAVAFDALRVTWAFGSDEPTDVAILFEVPKGSALDFLDLQSAQALIEISNPGKATQDYSIKVVAMWQFGQILLDVVILRVGTTWELQATVPETITLGEAQTDVGDPASAFGADVAALIPGLTGLQFSNSTLTFEFTDSAKASSDAVVSFISDVSLATLNTITGNPTQVFPIEVLVGEVSSNFLLSVGFILSFEFLNDIINHFAGITINLLDVFGGSEIGLVLSTGQFVSTSTSTLKFGLPNFPQPYTITFGEGITIVTELESPNCTLADSDDRFFCDFVKDNIFPAGTNLTLVGSFGKDPLAQLYIQTNSVLTVSIATSSVSVGPVQLGITILATGSLPALFIDGNFVFNLAGSDFGLNLELKASPGAIEAIATQLPGTTITTTWLADVVPLFPDMSITDAVLGVGLSDVGALPVVVAGADVIMGQPGVTNTISLDAYIGFHPDDPTQDFFVGNSSSVSVGDIFGVFLHAPSGSYPAFFDTWQFLSIIDTSFCMTFSGCGGFNNVPSIPAGFTLNTTFSCPLTGGIAFETTLDIAVSVSIPATFSLLAILPKINILDFVEVGATSALTQGPTLSVDLSLGPQPNFSAELEVYARVGVDDFNLAATVQALIQDQYIHLYFAVDVFIGTGAVTVDIDVLSGDLDASCSWTWSKDITLIAQAVENELIDIYDGVTQAFEDIYAAVDQALASIATELLSGVADVVQAAQALAASFVSAWNSFESTIDDIIDDVGDFFSSIFRRDGLDPVIVDHQHRLLGRGLYRRTDVACGATCLYTDAANYYDNNGRFRHWQDVPWAQATAMELASLLVEEPARKAVNASALVSNLQGQTLQSAYDAYAAQNAILKQVGNAINANQVPNAVAQAVSVTSQQINSANWNTPLPILVQTGPDPSLSGPTASTSAASYTFNPLDSSSASSGISDATLDARFPGQNLGSAGLRQLNNFAQYPPPVFTWFPADETRECFSSGRTVDQSFYSEASGYDPQILAGVQDTCPEPGLAVGHVLMRTGPACGEVVAETWTANDGCSHNSAKVMTVTLTDTTPPYFIDPPPVNVTDQCYSIRPQATLTASDICYPTMNTAILKGVIDPVTPRCKRRIIDYFWTVSDVCNNPQRQDQYITVLDNDPPVWDAGTFPADVNVEFMAPYGPDVTGFPSATDRCESNPVLITYSDAVTIPAQNVSATLLITRTFTTTDDCANAASRNQLIWVRRTHRNLGPAGLYALVVQSSLSLDTSLVEGQAFAGASAQITNSAIGNGTCVYLGVTLACDGPLLLSGSAVLQGQAAVNGPTQVIGNAPYVLNTTGSEVIFDQAAGVSTVQAWTAANQLRARVLVLGSLHTGPRLETCHIPVPGQSVYANAPGCNITTPNQVTDQFVGSLAGTTLNLTGTNWVYNIFNVTADMLSASTSIQITVPTTSFVFVNVINGVTSNVLNIDLKQKTTLPPGLNPRNILWTFQTLATTPTKLSLDGVPFVGSILAPDTTVNLESPSSIQGFLWTQVIQGAGFTQYCDLWAGVTIQSDVGATGTGTVNLPALIAPVAVPTSSSIKYGFHRGDYDHEGF